MTHTYLFEEGAWLTEGSYVDGDGALFTLRGRSVVNHGEGAWWIEGHMTLYSQPPVESHNDYAIRPFGSGQHATTWVSDNPALGRLVGQFTVVADTIVSLYGSEDGRHSGSEFLRRVDPDTYDGVGVLFRGPQRLSAWWLTLRRQVSGS